LAQQQQPEQLEQPEQPEQPPEPRAEESVVDKQQPPRLDRTEPEEEAEVLHSSEMKASEMQLRQPRAGQSRRQHDHHHHQSWGSASTSERAEERPGAAQTREEGRLAQTVAPTHRFQRGCSPPGVWALAQVVHEEEGEEEEEEVVRRQPQQGDDRQEEQHAQAKMHKEEAQKHQGHLGDP
jgi:hypothetical protein